MFTILYFVNMQSSLLNELLFMIFISKNNQK